MAVEQETSCFSSIIDYFKGLFCFQRSSIDDHGESHSVGENRQPVQDENDLEDLDDIATVIWRPEKFVSRQFPSAEEYRSQATEHFKRNNDLKKLGNSLKTSNARNAQQYFMQASNERKICERLNNKAAAVQLLENYRKNQSSNTLDLHELYKKEAMRALDIFLHKSLDWLRRWNRASLDIVIITGQGKHSRNNIPILKPAVVNRLRELNLRIIEENPGRLRTTIYPNLESRLNFC